MASDEQIEDLRKLADDQLLKVLGSEAYMQACVLMDELEQLVQPLHQTEAAMVLSTFGSLMALRYAERRRHG